jgi:prolyl oligopeptidase
MVAMTEELDDPYLWLEGVTDPAALEWVGERNAAIDAELAHTVRFARLRSEVKQTVDATDKIAYPSLVGGQLENLWQDAEHPRGLWRRTTLAEYRKPEPDWEILLDVDALGAAEGESWVFHGATWLRAGYDRALVSLSPGGTDAEVVREFDVPSRTFVPDGFTLPAAKSHIAWIDRDQVLVGTDIGPGSLTDSGYPRLVQRWRRGTPLSEAQTVFEGQVADVAVDGRHDDTGSRPRTFVSRYPDFFTGVHYLLGDDDSLTQIQVPLDADITTHRDWLLIRPRTDWTVGATTWPGGSLLVADLDWFVDDPQGAQLIPLFTPTPESALVSYHWTRNHLLLTTLTEVRSEIQLVSPPAPGMSASAKWRHESLGEADPGFTFAVIDTDRHSGDEFLITEEGFTQPTVLIYGKVGAGLEKLRTEPSFFDTDGIEVHQHFATSADGTRIPYLVVGRPDPDAPVLLSGYGGFEIARLPHYDPILGRGWLARGGRYALANIRGGGEFGPAWHHAAMREKRPRAYEDMAAVAEDLVKLGIAASPARLGFEGRSNGGLLAGVMLTRYPQLFGAVVSQVPLLDMRRYHLLLAGASWMAEYGDPDAATDWEFLSAYSPYHNVHSGRSYPPALFATSTRDDRVHPGHARKMVARMLEQGHDVRYYENVEGGHGGAADSAQQALRWALLFEFLWSRLGGDLGTD